jgi:hypothetical protein
VFKFSIPVALCCVSKSRMDLFGRGRRSTALLLLRDTEWPARLPILADLARRRRGAAALPRADLLVAFSRVRALEWLVGAGHFDLAWPLLPAAADGGGVGDGDDDDSDRDEDRDRNTQVRNTLHSGLRELAPWVLDAMQDGATTGEALLVLAAGTGALPALAWLDARVISAARLRLRWGRTVAHVAAARGQTAAVLWLTAQDGWAGRALSEEGLAPIHEAVRKPMDRVILAGHKSVVVRLVTGGLAVPDRAGRDWTWHALRSENEDLVDFARTALATAALAGALPRLLRDVASLAELQNAAEAAEVPRASLPPCRGSGTGPADEFLLLAAELGRVDVLRWLLPAAAVAGTLDPADGVAEAVMRLAKAGELAAAGARGGQEAVGEFCAWLREDDAAAAESMRLGLAFHALFAAGGGEDELEAMAAAQRAQLRSLGSTTRPSLVQCDVGPLVWPDEAQQRERDARLMRHNQAFFDGEPMPPDVSPLAALLSDMKHQMVLKCLRLTAVQGYVHLLRWLLPRHAAAAGREDGGAWLASDLLDAALSAQLRGAGDPWISDQQGPALAPAPARTDEELVRARMATVRLLYEWMVAGNGGQLAPMAIRSAVAALPKGQDSLSERAWLLSIRWLAAQPQAIARPPAHG